MAGMIASSSEIIEESPPQPVQVVEDKMYVAVGKDVEESKSVINWALLNSGGRRICILHVDAQRFPKMGPVRQLKEHHDRVYREVKSQEMDRLIKEYGTICSRAGVLVDVLHIEMDYIEKGIVELINQHGIRKLVMGAAADKPYSKKMKEPKSKKAMYVRDQAPTFCHIWFICEGHLVHTREGRSDGVSMEVAYSPLQASPNTETGQSSSLRSRSLPVDTNDQLKFTCSGPGPGPGYRRVVSDLHGMRVSTFSPNDSSRVAPRSSCSSVDMADDPASTKEEGRMKELYDQLKQSLGEADDESIRHRKAEKDAFDAIRRVLLDDTGA